MTTRYGRRRDRRRWRSRDPLCAYLIAGTRSTRDQRRIRGPNADAVTPATPRPDEPRPQWDRLTVEELELLRHLTAKLHGEESRPGANERLHLTIGPKDWVRREPGAEQPYYTRHIRLESLPITI